jgi:hypothetical protein
MPGLSRRHLLAAPFALATAARAAPPAPALPLPPVVDHSALFGPVKNQGDRQTCAYFAFTAAAEAALARLTGLPMALSEQYLTDLAWAGKRRPADETTSITTPGAMAFRYGMVPASILPYRGAVAADQPVPPPAAEVLAHRIRLDINLRAVRGLDKTLRRLAQQPLIIPLPSSNNWVGWHDSDGLFEPVGAPVPPGQETNHFVVFTGYDLRTQFFVFRSSWGPGWGRGGHGRVSFDSMRTRLAGTYLYYFDRFALI